jgi:hypothetical protein
VRSSGTGTVIRIGKKEAVTLAEFLQLGAIAARGTAIISPLGTMLHAHELGADEHSLQPVKKHKPDNPNEDEHEGRAGE